MILRKKNVLMKPGTVMAIVTAHSEREQPQIVMIVVGDSKEEVTQTLLTEYGVPELINIIENWRGISWYGVEDDSA